MRNPAGRIVALREQIRGLGSALIALSGGADSALLAALAADELGESAAAATAVGPLFAQHEVERAQGLCRRLGLRHELIEFDPLHHEAFVRNPPDRCFFCKHEMLRLCREMADRLELEHVCEGTNAQELSEHRPGLAAIRELCIQTPLLDAGLDKSDVRRALAKLGLNDWVRPSSTCLATRFAHGMPITREGLRRVEACEQDLARMGFTEFRVRHHGDSARIELCEDQLSRALDPKLRRAIVTALRGHGFSFVSLDLEGFSSGKMERNADKGV
ncbi:MAG: ATP-dependent sacrificial sulfur transferase LarE [Candidatus Alcyoniella australis]|nr:ATP-dependent sacrificial sulfur transferase LarE [Candidatus Alcyoniella australis]